MNKKSTRTRRYASTIPELSQEIDATQKSVASLRSEVTTIKNMIARLVNDRSWNIG